MTKFVLYEETWATIPDYPNYIVSNFGRALNVRTDRELKPVCNNKGYYLWSFCKEGVVKKVAVHRVVASIFHPDYVEGYAVVHKNDLKHDNGIANLDIGERRVRGEAK